MWKNNWAQGQMCNWILASHKKKIRTREITEEVEHIHTLHVERTVAHNTGRTSNLQCKLVSISQAWKHMWLTPYITHSENITIILLAVKAVEQSQRSFIWQSFDETVLKTNYNNRKPKSELYIRSDCNFF